MKKANNFRSFKGHIVDAVKRTIYDGEIIVKDGIIAEIKPLVHPSDETMPYFMPGFIDAHVHIESSMMVPRKFARIAVTHGTTGVIADPHEIGNVLGVAGVDYMIENAKGAQFNFCFGAPSCVPAVGGEMETNGAVINADDTEQLMRRKDIGFLAEMMNYPGVLNRDKEVMRKIEAALSNGKPIDGHAPGLTGTERNMYAAAGISTDHECSTIEEGRACIHAGMKVIIREGSAAKDYERLKALIAESPEMVMFCTDDCHSDDFVRGHINRIVKRALHDGFELWDVLQAACVNAQRHYHLNWGLLQEGDPATFIAVDHLNPHFRVEQTIINGYEVFNYNVSLLALTEAADEDNTWAQFPNRFVAAPITAADIALDLKAGDHVHVIHASDGSLLTDHEETVLTGNPLTDNRYPWTEVQKIVVYNRYVPDAKPTVGLVRGFGIKGGAIASSVAHDCHNIVAVGSSDEYIVQAINRVIKMRGGQVVVSEEEMIDLPLPVAGLMAPLNGHAIAFRTQLLHEMARKIGCQMKAPFITMAFMCLPVIPDLKITDKHLIDTRTMQFI